MHVQNRFFLFKSKSGAENKALFFYVGKKTVVSPSEKNEKNKLIPKEFILLDARAAGFEALFGLCDAGARISGLVKQCFGVPPKACPYSSIGYTNRILFDQFKQIIQRSNAIRIGNSFAVKLHAANPIQFNHFGSSLIGRNKCGKVAFAL